MSNKSGGIATVLTTGGISSLPWCSFTHTQRLRSSNPDRGHISDALANSEPLIGLATASAVNLPPPERTKRPFAEQDRNQGHRSGIRCARNR